MMEIDPVAIYGYEVLGGWIGAAGGGVGGFMLALLLCLMTLGDNAGYEALGCFVGGGALGYLIGTPVGATVGVSVIAHFLGLEGNVWMSMLGGVLGEGAGLITVGGLAGIAIDSDLGGVGFILGVPLVSSIGATMGFNLGATPDEENAQTIAQP